MKERRSRLLLDPNTVARRLGRPLRGDPSGPSDEYLLLHLLNTAQRVALEELLAQPEANPGIGIDLMTLVQNRLRRESQVEASPPVEYPISVPAAVWQRYAQRAREGHRRVDSELVDALVRDDDRLCQARQDVNDAREAFRVQVSELGEQLMTLKNALDAAQMEAPRLEREASASLKGLSDHMAAQGFAIAAVLKVLHDRGWVAKPLVTALRARGWLTE